jgi:hypothetical protein
MHPQRREVPHTNNTYIIVGSSRFACKIKGRQARSPNRPAMNAMLRGAASDRAQVEKKKPMHTKTAIARLLSEHESSRAAE